jgi:hypothetical protein
VRSLWPIPGGVVLERHFDTSGNLSSTRTVGWAVYPPPGLENRGETQV